MITKKEVRGIIRDTLGVEEELNESLVLQQKQFDLSTELLTAKNKKSHRDLYENRDMLVGVASRYEALFSRGDVIATILDSEQDMDTVTRELEALVEALLER